MWHLFRTALSQAEIERLLGPLTHKSAKVNDIREYVPTRTFQLRQVDCFEHVRIQFRMPWRLGLVKCFYVILKKEEVLWQMYDGLNHSERDLAEFRERYKHVYPDWTLYPPSPPRMTENETI